MQTEIEAKFLDIDPEVIRAKLRDLGATLVQSERLMRRKNYDFEDLRLQKINGWVRVRDEGNKVTLAYKQLNDRTLHGTKEVNVTVSDFDSTCDFLESIGLVSKTYQETKRESWILDGAEVEIDTWPWIPTYIEIEAETEDVVRSVASKLGLEWSKALHGSVEIAYQAVYDVSEADVDGWPLITFVAVPESLESRRRK